MAEEAVLLGLFLLVVGREGEREVWVLQVLMELLASSMLYRWRFWACVLSRMASRYLLLRMFQIFACMG